MKKVKIALIAAGLFLTAIFVYYFVIIMNARVKTPDIVSEALSPEKIHLELDDLTNKQIDALLKIQDPNFYYHNGFDPTTPGAGITSLSQGLVKKFYFDKFKPGTKKIEQTLIAMYAFDAMTPKDTILTLFINYAYMGQRDSKPIYGFEDASDFYFKKKFKDLDEDQYLALIAMIRAPFAFHYLKKRGENDLRVSRIKRYLAGEYIPQDNSDWLYDREQSE
ncbi:MAG: transglycosylase domain-containing protein [Cyclobacteriaceae bacterium]